MTDAPYCDHPLHSRPPTVEEMTRDYLAREEAIRAHSPYLRADQLQQLLDNLQTFAGYRRCTLFEEKALPTNLDDAVAIVDQIDQVRAVQRELKAAFARSELDGGAKAAVDHPLYLEAVVKLEELHDEMMGLI